MKNCSLALVLCGARLFFFFFYLSELLGVDTTLRCKCFRRNVFFWLLCQLLDYMCPSLFPNWPLYLPPFNTALWLFHPLLSLAGQNQSSMGRLTAGMLSVQFPPPQGRIVIWWEFRFQLFDLWPKNRCLGQAAQLPQAYLATLLELCGPRPPSEMPENYFCQI